MFQNSGKIQFEWRTAERKEYLYLRASDQPTEQEWVKETINILESYQASSVFMIIDTAEFEPVMTKAGFDRMIKTLMSRGLKSSTVAVVLSDQHYQYVARMFEASTDAFGFDLELNVFPNLIAAENWMFSKLLAN